MEPDQLFAAFEETVAEYKFDFGHGDVTVTDFMRHWTEQAGYPVIGVAKVDGSFVLTQVRTAAGRVKAYFLATSS